MTSIVRLSVCVLIFVASQLVQEEAQDRAGVKGGAAHTALRRSYNGSLVQHLPKTCSSSRYRQLHTVKIINLYSH
jgi:hypothetical protein